jgi:hypothetical protein
MEAGGLRTNRRSVAAVVLVKEEFLLERCTHSGETGAHLQECHSGGTGRGIQVLPDVRCGDCTNEKSTLIRILCFRIMIVLLLSGTYRQISSLGMFLIV